MNAVNATLEVDFLGQCASGSLGPSYWSSSGGRPVRVEVVRQRVADLLTRLEYPSARTPLDWHTTMAYLVELNAWVDRHHIQLR